MAEMFKWPEWMGCPLVSGYGLEVVDRRVSTEMEIGSSIRVEFDTDECVASCSMSLDGIQASFFERLERDKLNQGTVPFIFPLWVGGQLVEHVVRFRTRPTITGKYGAFTEYSFTLDVGQRLDLMPDWLFDLLAAIDRDFLLFVTNRLHYILHVKAPKSTNTPPNIWAATEEEWEAAK